MRRRRLPGSAACWRCGGTADVTFRIATVTDFGLLAQVETKTGFPFFEKCKLLFYFYSY